MSLGICQSASSLSKYGLLCGEGLSSFVNVDSQHGWVVVATSEIVSPGSNFFHDGTVNSTALKNLKKPKQHVAYSMFQSLA